MFSTLLIKEIHDTINNSRSMFAALLCLLIIPLGMFINAKEFESRENAYIHAKKVYYEQSKGKVNSGFDAQGFRPPSALSIFANGMENVIPNKVRTQDNGIYILEKDNQRSNGLAELFGPLDFLFIVGSILSILALIFTFNSVSGERESGTLKLVISNSVPRWKFILAKITGTYIVFIVFFLLSFIIGLLILLLDGSVSLAENYFWTNMAIILIITFGLIFIMFSFGTLASCLTRDSVSSIVILLFIWVILFSFIPKVSPIIAEIVYPVKKEKAIADEKFLVRQEMEQELDAVRKETLENMLSKNGISPNEISFDNMGGPGVQEVFRKYDESFPETEKEYQDKIVKAMQKIDQDYAQKLKTQQSIAKNISRLSPISCYMYLMTEIASTGLLEMRNFNDYAARYQDKVEQEVYSKFSDTKYMFGGSVWVMSNNRGDTNTDNIEVPHLENYSFLSIEKILFRSLPDLLLLLLYLIVIPWITFVVFSRYDVR